MLVGRHVYYTGLCTECGRRRYVWRSDGRIGKHSPRPYPRTECAGVGSAAAQGSLRCHECAAPVEGGRITHRTGCAYLACMEDATHDRGT